VKRRIKALKKLQLATTQLEAKFFEEVHDLEVKYLELYKPQYEARAKVVQGKEITARITWSGVGIFLNLLLL